MALKDLVLIFITATSFLVKGDHFNGECHPGFYRPPKCVDTSVAYQCECGPGFEWNSNLCVSKAIDSRLEFLEREPVRYTLLLGKNFPALKAFTISCWLKLISDGPAGTLLSYATKKGQIGQEELQLTIAKQIQLNVRGRSLSINVSFERNRWIHLAITWAGKDGAYNVYKNGKLVQNATGFAKGSEISYGGRLVLGQSSNDPDKYNFVNSSTCRKENRRPCPEAFQGELSYLNIWSKPLSANHISQMYRDCTFTYCGDAVEWVDFRSGTRGAMKLRWPSKIFKGHEAECQIDKEEKCDDWCTLTIGPQCDQHFSENILWPRTPAGETHSSIPREMPCPGIVEEPPDPEEEVEDGGGQRWRKADKLVTEKPNIRYAYRYCIDSGNYTGIWGVANVTECQSELLRERLERFKWLAEEKDLSNKTLILIRLDELKSSTDTSRGQNPSDLAADIEAIRYLVKAQDNTLNQSASTRTYPTLADTVRFAKTAMLVLNNTVDYGDGRKNTMAWKETGPRGAEAVQVLEVFNDLTDLLVKSLVSHVRWNDTTIDNAVLKIFQVNLALVVRVYDARRFSKDVKFPTENMPKSVFDGRGEIIVPGSLLTDNMDNVPEENWPEYIGMSNGRFNTLAGLLPNHPEPVIVKFYSDKDKEFLHLEQNVNTVIMSARVHSDDGSNFEQYITMTNESDPIEFTMRFTDTTNYSHPECVSIDMEHNPPDYWEWISDDCEVVDLDRDAKMAICQCHHLGIFAITTDMFDPDWDPGDPPRFKMNAASYIGILISVSLYAVSLVTYIYLRCETDTVAIHRNLAASIVALQLCFLIGVGRTENEIVCKMFAILLHFLLLSSFLWVCNEAFNLYVEVANTIHTDTQQQRPMLRYYVIGWGVPAVLVGTLVKVYWETYFSPEVCLIDVQHIWFLVGPVGGIWIVTVFVLVYTGKDIMESSYSKDKEANKIIANHNKGCWIQNTLLMIAMAFAVCSAIMYSRIPQILFAMFTILQGAFFFMFFCVLNGEVVELLAERRTSLGISVASPSLPRSTKYSVYKRYVPIRSGSSSRRTSPTHTSGGGSSPRPEKKQKSGKETEHQSADDRGSPAAKGHRSLTTVSSSDSRADSPLIGLGSATLVRKLMPGIRKRTEEERDDAADLATIALRSDSPDQEHPISKDMVTTV